MHFSHVPPTQYCKYTMTTPTPVQRTLFTLWKMKVKRMSSVSCFFPDVPSIVTTYADLEENPDAGQRKSILWLCGSMMSNSAHCRIINCPRVEAIGTFLKGTNQFVERHFACDDVSQEDGLRLRANILTSLPVSAKFISVHRHFTVRRFRT
jgi:hypothetical protein